MNIVYNILMEGNTETSIVTMKDIKKLNSKLNKFGFGAVVDGKLYSKEEMDWSKYKTLTLEEMEKFKVGVCWDFVNYEANWFTNNKIPFETYMFVMQMSDNVDDIITHTFLIFSFENKKYWFESAWYGHQWIQEVESYDDVIETLTERYGEDHPYSLYKFKADKSLLGITNREYFRKVTRNLVKNKK